MKLKISTPSQVIYQGEIKEISLPSENGVINVSGSSVPMVVSLNPWIIRILPVEIKPGFVVTWNEISISTSKWMAFVDGKIVRIVTSEATVYPQLSANKLNQTKEDLEQQIRKLKIKWSIEEIERLLIQLQKINADIKLEKMKHLA